jgi:hypothetical protein
VSWAAIAGLLLAGSPGSALARQELLGGEPLPREIAEDLVRFLNDSEVIRFDGRASVPDGARLTGDVGVLDGSLTVNGLVEGGVVVVGGDLEVGASGVITGDVILVGGRLRGDVARIEGGFSRYDETFTFVVRDGRVGLRDPPDRREGLYLGRSRLTLRAGTNYNRSEGLPIVFGPVIESRSSNPFRVEALAIYRTESGPTRDRVGYEIAAEQRFGSPVTFSIRGGAYSNVVPIEYALSDLEASLGAFFLHRDYRDYFERRGWNIGVGMGLPSIPLDVSLDYRNERHFSLAVGSPWTLVRNDEAWRPMPVVAEGTQELLDALLVFDTRNDEDQPTDGWLVRATGLFGIGRDPLVPGVAATPETPVADGVPADGGFATGSLDVRRYARVDPWSHLSFRAFLAGSLDDESLPPQYQHALGGEGTLPGLSLFELDCGARAARVFLDRELDPEVFPYYGCDRVALFQMEYRKTFAWDLELGPEDDEWEEWSWYPRIDLSPAFSLFVEGGQGWSSDSARPNTRRGADAGVGLHLGDLSFYWAYPLEGGNDGVNFFMRFSRRF